MMARRRHFTITTPDGKEFTVFPGSKPDHGAVMALLALFKAAFAHMQGDGK